jgi:hypothetical protein
MDELETGHFDALAATRRLMPGRERGGAKLNAERSTRLVGRNIRRCLFVAFGSRIVQQLSRELKDIGAEQHSAGTRGVVLQQSSPTSGAAIQSPTPQ